MTPTKQALAKILTLNAKISVPIYQRQYAWEEERVQAFWDDLIRLSKDKGSTHYMGTMVKRPEPTLDGGVPHFMVIDGQQRMTVLMLLSAAIRDYIKKDRLLADYLNTSDRVNERLKADPHRINLHLPLFLDQTYLHYFIDRTFHKFLPTELNKDREVFTHVVYDGTPDKRKKHHRHYQLLVESLKSAVSDFSTLNPQISDMCESKVAFLHEILDGLGRMQIVFIELEESDDPQQIFESINHKGEPLTVTDLIRNHLLTLASEGDRKVLFKQIWEPLEDSLCQKRDKNEGVLRQSLFEGFFRAFAGMNGKVVPGKKLYAQLRDLLQEDLRGVDPSNTASIVSKLRKFSEYAVTYQSLVWSGAGVSPELSVSVEKFSRLDFTTPMSLMMLYFGRDTDARPDDKITAQAFKVLENYYLRRALLGRTVKRMSDFFAHLCTLWYKESPPAVDFPLWLERKLILETREDFSNLKPVYDSEILTEITRSRVYSLSRTATSFALCALEGARSTTSGVINNLTSLDVEHVLPQEHEEHWMKDLKQWHASVKEFPTDVNLQTIWINDKVDLLRDTLGNLTLTNFNRSLKHFSFKKKRDFSDSSTAEKGYKDTNIRIARDDFGSLENWTFDKIEDRSVSLCKELIMIYPEFDKTQTVV